MDQSNFFSQSLTNQSVISNQEVRNDREIKRYIEENLIMDMVYAEVENLVLSSMQDVFYQNKKIPSIIAEEIFEDMLRDQIRTNAII